MFFTPPESSDVAEAPVTETPEVETPEVETESTDEVIGTDLTGDESEGGTTDKVEDSFELVIDGETVKMTKAELIASAQKAKAADKRMQAAGKEKADALRLIELARTDPLAFAKSLDPNLNERDFLSKRLAQMMEEDMLSPEERQTRADMTELQRLRAQQKEHEQAQQHDELNKMAAEQQVVLDKEIAAAIQSVNLPRTKAAVKRVAEYMLEAMEAGISVPTDKIAAQVKKDMQAELMELLSSSDDDAFEQLLGKDLLTKAQKASLKKVKTPGEKVAPSTTPKEKVTKAKESPEDWLRSQGIF